MLWEERLLAVFDDLEQQAAGLALSERDAEVAELGRAAYASVDLASRLHDAPGRQVRLVVWGLGPITGEVVRVGSDFLVLDDAGRLAVVRTAALVRVAGLSDHAVGAEARSLPARVGLGSVLRGFAEAAVPLAAYLVDGTLVHGRTRRVGADFVELWDIGPEGDSPGTWQLLPFESLAALRPSVGH